MGNSGFTAGKSRDAAPDPPAQEKLNEEITFCTWNPTTQIHLCSRPSHPAIPNISPIFQEFRWEIFPYSPWRRGWHCCSCPALLQCPGQFLMCCSFDRELIAELWDYVCISKSFFLSWKVSSSKLGFPLHPLSPGVNSPFAGRVCLVSSHQNIRDKRKREGGILNEKSVFSWVFSAC